MHQSEGAFAKALFVIAKLSSFELEDPIVEMYVEAVRPYGFERAAEAVYKLAKGARPGRVFPSVDDIIQELAPETKMSDEDQASLMAAGIINAIGIYGQYNVEAAEKALGEVAWAALGGSRGWVALCEIDNDDVPTTRAQLRKQAQAMLLRSRGGSLPQIAGETNAFQRALLIANVRSPDELVEEDRKKRLDETKERRAVTLHSFKESLSWSKE